MPAQLRLAVLSDQHIHTTASSASWELAKRAFCAAARCDHVVLAGDTFDSATAFTIDHGRVRDELTRLGLWHRDRLTVVVGNHDLFHTPHHGTKASRAVELARNALSFDARGLVRDPAVERAFDDWVGDLVGHADRVDAQRPYPLRKMVGHVALYAADTSPRRTLSAANGFWRPETDALLRAATPEADERRVLAIHHPPKASRQTRAIDLSRGVTPTGFPPKNHARLVSFVEDAELDAVVCGHVHATKRYQWDVGRAKVPAFMVGRSGGLHRREPVMGVLTVPKRGRLRWGEIAV